MHACADDTTPLTGLQNQLLEACSTPWSGLPLHAMHAQVSMYITP